MHQIQRVGAAQRVDDASHGHDAPVYGEPIRLAMPRYHEHDGVWDEQQLPADGFKVACFPVKIARASAGWTRAVAIIGD